MIGEELVLECSSCVTEAGSPRVTFGEDADVFKSDGGPASILLFIGAHRDYPGHWDPEKHHLRVKLGDHVLHPSEVIVVLSHLPWLVERVTGSYR